VNIEGERAPFGRPPHEVHRFHADFRYQAGSWTNSRRVVAKIEWHPANRIRVSGSS
jgi:hypothetical protein